MQVYSPLFFLEVSIFLEFLVNGGYAGLDAISVIDNRTISGNESSYSAGGIMNSGTLPLTRSTLTNNAAGVGSFVAAAVVG